MKTKQLEYNSDIAHLFRPEHKEIEICFKLFRNKNNKQDEILFQFSGKRGFTLT